MTPRGGHCDTVLCLTQGGVDPEIHRNLLILETGWVSGEMLREELATSRNTQLNFRVFAFIRLTDHCRKL